MRQRLGVTYATPPKPVSRFDSSCAGIARGVGEGHV